ncbi:cold-shock protein [Streptomyces sp. NPDC058674]|uniref:cold-shock protein n=1 Tax=Streptomyces sp. NPDC058674 TaxID=3346592 RepID=UPI0036651965
MKWFDPARGIGLISQEGDGPDVHAEASAIQGKDDHLRPGEEVFFNITLDSAGLRADNIHRTDHREARPSNPSTPSSASTSASTTAQPGSPSTSGRHTTR